MQTVLTATPDHNANPTLAPVEIRIGCPGPLSRDIASRVSFFKPDGNDLVFPSWLAADKPIDEHLKWLYGMLQHERKFFRRLEASGVSIVVFIRSQNRELSLTPEALLLMHKFHLPTEVIFSK